jgi:medium-chain acyl-[acyl-carrier-protein] hydrolase
MSASILFCLPYAGGSARSLSNVTYRLHSSVQVKELELPGRGNRHLEPLTTDLNEIIDDLYESICDTLSDSSIRIFIWGHSMGAILALLLAARLNKKGNCNIGGLIVSAMTGPEGINKGTNKLHLLPHKEFFEYFSKMIPPGKGIVDKNRNDKLLERTLLILRSDISALENFKIANLPSIVIDAPIHVLKGSDDEIMPAHFDYNSWGIHTSDYTRHYLVNGGHFFVLEQSLQTANIIQEIINN